MLHLSGWAMGIFLRRNILKCFRSELGKKDFISAIIWFKSMSRNSDIRGTLSISYFYMKFLAIDSKCQGYYNDLPLLHRMSPPLTKIFNHDHSWISNLRMLQIFSHWIQQSQLIMLFFPASELTRSSSDAKHQIKNVVLPKSGSPWYTCVNNRLNFERLLQNSCHLKCSLNQLIILSIFF